MGAISLLLANISMKAKVFQASLVIKPGLKKLGYVYIWRKFVNAFLPTTLVNTRPFLRSSIISFWITPAHSKERKYHIFRQYCLVHQKCSSIHQYQGFWIYLYFRIRHSFAHLRPVILSADWLVNQLIAKLDLFKSSDCRWICKTYAEYCYSNSSSSYGILPNTP